MTTDPITERLLERARDALRNTREPGWDVIVESVLERVRATPRKGWPIRAEDPTAGIAPGGIAISDVVLSGEIARAMRRLDDVELVAVDVSVDGERLSAIRVELAGRYGVPLGAAGGTVRSSVVAVLAEVLGAVADEVPVDVVFVDVAGRPGD